MIGRVLCAAVDIGSNTTRVLVAEPQDGQLRKVMEQRAYTRFDKDSKRKGKVTDEKIAELAEVVTTQVRLAEELGAEAIRIVATAAIREAKNAEEVAKRIADGGRARGRGPERGGGGPAGVHRRDQDPRAPGRGRDRRRRRRRRLLGDHPRHRRRRGAGRCARSRSAPARWPRSSSPTIRPRRPRSARCATTSTTSSTGSRSITPAQAVAVGGSATSLRTLVGAVLEYETLERAVRVLTGDSDRRRREAVRARPSPGADPARRGADPGEALRAARPAAADRQGRAARGDHPRPAPRRHQRRHRRRSLPKPR